MKKTEYTGSRLLSDEEKRHELDAEKLDDYELPEFSKEVPTASKITNSKEGITVQHEWKNTKSPSIKIKKFIFRKEEALADLYRVAARDGADSLCFKHNGVTYIIRKTIADVAQALYNAYKKLGSSLETIVGYFRTVLENDYVLAKVSDQDCWAFDKRIARGDLKYLDVGDLQRNERTKLGELITEKIAELHAGNLVLGRFSLNNVLLGKNGLMLSDLRKLRATRKRSYPIDEFKSILQYLFGIGVAAREDIYSSVAYYTTKNESRCKEWYFEKTGKKTDDSFDIALKLEEEVYN